MCPGYPVVAGTVALVLAVAVVLEAYRPCEAAREVSLRLTWVGCSLTCTGGM